MDIKWRDFSEIPQKEGKAIFKIGDSYFIGSIFDTQVYVNSEMVWATLNKCFSLEGSYVYKYTINKPSHFKDVEKWAYLED